MENNSIADIVEKVKSGIIHIVHVLDGERVSSGTGFMVNGYLVTNHHVIYKAPSKSKIVLKTYDSDRKKVLEGIIELERDEHGYFSGLTNKSDKQDGSFIQALSKENKNDYIVFDIPELREEKLKTYNFSFGSHDNKRIGEPIFFLGYHFDHFRLTCHTGIISSFNERNGGHIIQVDASVNSGNSGSPLIDPITHEVIGIITRKETGLDKNFNTFYSVIKNNIDFLNSERLLFIQQQDKEIQKRINDIMFNKGIFERGYNKIQDNINYRDSIGRIIEQLSNNNANLLEIAKQIERSANVGIGYAFSVDKLKKEKCFSNEVI
ncbi:trypsin-like peptidase domain-containing protein [Dolichospermum circinale CS-537/01]|uniref:Trypsin-like peptidase domain-containing protein n=1 Tax=Dolichospermum circinale CS-537/01 TaxID=3021739 RepID=A0ABT5A5M5_9CYAN|nr:trypsin-like peptidase domain-containing protein [Dolichospermum circinale]MDB9487246.1 trypsin-like peptidase domain-containing protein [Dolichospermum circinale CS-537/01]